MGKFFVGGFYKHGPIWEDDGGDDAFTVVLLFYEFFSFRVFIGIDPGEFDLVVVEEFFCAAAISAPVGAVNGDVVIFCHFFLR